MPENELEGRSEPLAGGARQAVLVAGVCSMIVGVVVAVWPHKSLPNAESLFGAYLLLNGALQWIVAFGARIAAVLRVLVFGSGLASMLLAVLCFGGGNSALLLSFWIALAWAVRGICHATVAVWSDNLVGSGRQEAFGLATLALGIVVAVLPFDSVDALGVVAGLLIVGLGAMEVLSVVAVRRGVVDMPAVSPMRAVRFDP
ncbi:uncharacterized membrane protein HdeD (DUF308 family) [Nocardia tenerifensis]|uniref:Uncharacterized membrane protein HdeD (DUF308 family) n=1 Tax=Nocardia tenerifensis TaxID=228006 RepID=A0A318KEX3_9NOCA|nr:DUF308 domain-containing protein [Nocardia tenerifensis]PXX70822.1 uncharacterized membrane protein HdeD (DUF308 family) [Nocardia tenerifensis]